MNKKTLWKLFTTMFSISAFTFGGGFAIIGLMKKKIVDELKWISNEEMLDYTAMAQLSPGAIAVNAAILVGYKVMAFPGMLVAILGTIFPPIIILSIISLFYHFFISNIYVSMFLNGLRAGVAAVIVNVVFDLGGNVLKEHSIYYDLIMILTFVAIFFFHVSAILIVLIVLLLGIVSAVWRHKGGIQP